MNPCELCGEDTDAVFLIKRIEHHVCSDCATEIFATMAKAYSKEKTIFDINKRKHRVSPKKYPAEPADILNFLTKESGHKSKIYTKDNVPKSYLDLISTRLSEKHSVDDIKSVVYHKCREWKDDNYMQKFLRPATLFSKTKFDTYLAEIDSKEVKDDSLTPFMKKIVRMLNGYMARGEAHAPDAQKLAQRLKNLGYDNNDYLNLFSKN